MVLRTSAAEKHIPQVKQALQALKSMFCRRLASTLHQARVKAPVAACAKGLQVRPSMAATRSLLHLPAVCLPA